MFCLHRLEGGCHYDYIEVFDGPYHSSPLIARVCDGAQGSFTSSSNFLSVRFVSDSSVTRRGFQAEFYSLPSNDSTSESLERVHGWQWGHHSAFWCSAVLWLWNKEVEQPCGSPGLDFLLKGARSSGPGTLGGQEEGQGPALADGQRLGPVDFLECKTLAVF